MFSEIKNGSFEEIRINEGDIIRIMQDGTIKLGKFNYIGYYGDHILCKPLQ
ncbi:MAG: hypothetical protein Q4G33_15395 [bacterium]|nr:hypothetical protein [bacterium]